jgi:predicted nucleotidyltransferase
MKLFSGSVMPNTDITHETRLSVRLQGPLAEHADRQVESALYKSHSEYIRDLVRRDLEKSYAGEVHPVTTSDGSQGALLDELRRKKAGIGQLAARYGARNIRVFGSVARREEGPGSDVDLLVEFPKGYSMFRQRLPLARELSALIGRKVDLLPDREINRHIRDSILEDAVAL